MRPLKPKVLIDGVRTIRTLIVLARQRTVIRTIRGSVRRAIGGGIFVASRVSRDGDIVQDLVEEAVHTHSEECRVGVLVAQGCEHGGEGGVPACDAGVGLFVRASVYGRDVDDEVVPCATLIQLDG